MIAVYINGQLQLVFLNNAERITEVDGKLTIHMVSGDTLTCDSPSMKELMATMNIQEQRRSNIVVPPPGTTLRQ
jgi:hypothetical protein